MDRFLEKLESLLVPVAGKFANNRYLQTIGNGSMSLLAIIMLGAFASIFVNIDWEPYNNLMDAANLKEIIGFVPAVTTDLLGLYMAFSVGYAGAKVFDHEESSFNIGLLSLFAFLVLVPFGSMDVGSFAPASVIQVDYLGPKAIFTALIGGLIVTRVVTFILDKDLTLRLPSSIPPAVGNSFRILVPAAIIAIIFVSIKIGFDNTTYGSATDFVYGVLQSPLEGLTSTLPAFLVALTIANILWFFGVHGSFTVLPLFMPIWLGFAAQNAAAGEAVNVLNIAMWDLACIGGAGAGIGLAILMFFRSKSEQYKSLGKATLPSSTFSVSEPMIFGFPIILNPIMFIPFILTPIVIVSLGYGLISLGIIGAPMGVFGAASLPPFFSGLAQGSVTFALYQLVAVAISVVIYYPFFKVADKIAVENAGA